MLMKNRNLLLVLSALLSLSLISCSFKKDSDKDKGNAPADDIARELEEREKKRLQGEVISPADFVFEVVEDEEPNRYLVKVSFPSVPGVRVFFWKDSDLVQDLKNEMIFHSRGGTPVDFHIKAANSIGTPLVDFSKKVIVPIDHTFANETVLTSDLNLNVGRLYFIEKASLKTNGFHVSIQANKIISNAGVKIYNFLPSEIWKTEQQRLGGSVVLRAKSAEGYLQVHLQGAKGKDGKSGTYNENDPSEMERFSGQPGEPGEDAKIPPDSEECDRDGRCGLVYRHCLAPPTDGQNGGDGRDGENGEDGAPGGDTGNLLVNINNSENFTLKVKLSTGVPGQPGRGAKGYPGGAGGSPGQQDPKRLCPAAQAGAPGTHGAHGKDGRPGLPGRVGTIEYPGLINAIIEK